MYFIILIRFKTLGKTSAKIVEILLSLKTAKRLTSNMSTQMTAVFATDYTMLYSLEEPEVYNHFLFLVKPDKKYRITE